MGDKKINVIVKLSEELVRELDEEAKKMRVSRRLLIEHAVEEYLKSLKDSKDNGEKKPITMKTITIRI